jgi:hypothetical protein
MMRYPKHGAHPGSNLVWIPPLHIWGGNVWRHTLRDVRNQVQASDSKKSDAYHRLAAKIVSLMQKMLQEERDDGEQPNPAPESTCIEAGFGADAE